MKNACNTSQSIDSIAEIISRHGAPLTKLRKSALGAALEVRPQLGNFINENASLTLPEYGKKITATSKTLSNEFKKTISYITAKLHGGEASSRLGAAYERISSIDTSGHGGILSEDTLIQSHAAISEGVEQNETKAFLSLSCGVVPMNNATWPRGFFVLGERESLFPKSFDKVAFHECPPFTKQMIEKKLKDPKTTERSRRIFEIISKDDSIFSVSRFHLQASKLNHALWNNFIKKDSVTSPEFFQLMLEDLTSELVIRSITTDDALSKLIFCKDKQALFFEELANLPGTWSPDRSKGTFLFWHASGDFRNASLWVDNGKLNNNLFSINYTPEELTENLQSRTIVPSVFLSLITLLHHGVRPLGGYHQIWYLPEYQSRLARFAANSPETVCPDFLKHINCTDLFQLGYGLSFFEDPSHLGILAGLDSFIDSTPTRDAFWASLKETTVATAVSRNIKRWYLELVPASKRTIHSDAL